MAKLDVELDNLLVKKSLYEKHPEELTYFVDPGIDRYLVPWLGKRVAYAAIG
jgi:hypothetical protein